MNKPVEIIPVSNESPIGKAKMFFTLIQLRNRHNVTQKELANELEIDRSFLSRIETGRRKPSHEILIRIAAYFEVEVEDLYIDAPTVEMAMQMIAEDVTAMFDKEGDTLSKDDRHYLLQLIRTLRPTALAEEKTVTIVNKDGKKVRESVHRKLAQYGIDIKGK